MVMSDEPPFVNVKPYHVIEVEEGMTISSINGRRFCLADSTTGNVEVYESTQCLARFHVTDESRLHHNLLGTPIGILRIVVHPQKPIVAAGWINMGPEIGTRLVPDACLRGYFVAKVFLGCVSRNGWRAFR